MNYLQAIHLPPELQQRNHEVKKVYFKIRDEIVQLSKRFESDSLRTRVEVDHKENPDATSEAYELLTPCIFLDLTADETGKLGISYAVNDCASRYIGQYYYNQLIRIIYKLTSSSTTEVCIEDCLSVYPYFSDVYDDARHIVRDQEHNFYKLTTEEYQGS